MPPSRRLPSVRLCSCFAGAPPPPAADRGVGGRVSLPSCAPDGLPGRGSSWAALAASFAAPRLLAAAPSAAPARPTVSRARARRSPGGGRRPGPDGDWHRLGAIQPDQSTAAVGRRAPGFTDRSGPRPRFGEASAVAACCRGAIRPSDRDDAPDRASIATSGSADRGCRGRPARMRRSRVLIVSGALPASPVSDCFGHPPERAPPRRRLGETVGRIAPGRPRLRAPARTGDAARSTLGVRPIGPRVHLIRAH